MESEKKAVPLHKLNLQRMEDVILEKTNGPNSLLACDMR